MTVARELWKRIESIHAVTYFTPESVSAAKQAGLKGFWMGYFGFRAAPMGAVAPGTVRAAFANFAPAMVERSLPDAWAHASPGPLIDTRASAAAAALRRLSPGLSHMAAEDLEGLNRSLASIVASACSLGRPLFAANADLDPRADAVEQLWQHCTTLREHRGDGHVMALAVAQVDGCEAHQLHAASHNTPHEVLRDNRGFTMESWDAAHFRLRDRGLLDESGLTSAGHELINSVESLTDQLAGEAIAASGVDADALIESLTPAANDITESGVLPFPNPMGLPKL